MIFRPNTIELNVRYYSSSSYYNFLAYPFEILYAVFTDFRLFLSSTATLHFFKGYCLYILPEGKHFFLFTSTTTLKKKSVYRVANKHIFVQIELLARTVPANKLFGLNGPGK